MAKNKAVFKICFVISALSMLGSNFAYAANTINGAISLGGGSFSPSKSVSISVDTGNGTNTACQTDSTTSNPCNAYGARSKHSSGDRILGTNNNDPKTYFSAVAVSAPLGDASVTDTYSGWTAL